MIKRRAGGPWRWLLVVMLASGGCAAPMNKGSHCALEPGSLDDARTFTWQAIPPVDLDDKTGYISPIIVEGLEKAAIAELQRKGLTFTEGKPEEVYADLRVALTLRTRREVVSLSRGGSPCETSDCWERIDLGSVDRMEVRTIGFLAADIYYLGQPVWRGWVERTLYPEDRDNADNVLGEAIPALFESFPP